MLNMKVIKYKRSTIVSLVARWPFTKVKVKKKAKRKLEVQTNPRPIPLTTFTKVYKEGEIIYCSLPKRLQEQPHHLELITKGKRV